MSETRKIGNYVFDTNRRPITKNRFGGTYPGRDEVNNRDVAVTVIPVTKIRSNFDQQEFQNKVEYLKAIRGPNVVQLYDIIVVPAPGYIYVVTEACHHRELGILLERTRTIPEAHALRLVRHIASAIRLIREMAPTFAGHRYSNLLQTNKLLTPNTVYLQGGRVKIADSGIFALLEDAIHVNDYPEPVESSVYEAPEVYKQSDDVLQGKADIWSLGVIFYHCLFGDFPFKGNAAEEQHDYLERNGLHFPDEVTNETKDLLQRMLTLNPKSRISWEEILAHPAMKHALVLKKEGERRSFKDLEINLVTALENTFNEIEDPSILLCPHLKPLHEKLLEKDTLKDEYEPVQEIEDEVLVQNNLIAIGGMTRNIETEKKEEQPIQVYQEKAEQVETQRPVEQTQKMAEQPVTTQPGFGHPGTAGKRKQKRLSNKRHKCNIF